MKKTVKCGKCGKRKPTDKFYVDKKRKTGRHYWCIECCKEYRKQPERRERHMLAQRRYRQCPEYRRRENERQKLYWRQRKNSGNLS